MDKQRTPMEKQRIDEVIPMYKPSIIRLFSLTLIAFLAVGIILLYTIPATKVVNGKAIIERGSIPPHALVYLPAEGTGEIQPGMEVRVHLSNYPSSEYGYLKGEVHSFLNGGTPDEAGQYLLKVRLPQGLQTSNGSRLSNHILLQGSSEIILKNRRFIDEILESMHTKQP